MNWYRKTILAQGVQSLVQEGTGRGKDKFFFVVYGNTFDIKDDLRRLGFRYFQGRWSTFIERAQSVREQLEQLGVNTSPLDQALTPAAAAEQPQAPDADAEPSAPQTPVEQQLASMKAGVEEAIADAPASDKAKNLLQYIDDTIDKLGTMVDEAAASEFVKRFLAFSAKFWKYSFGNQMLIWFQKPDATQVAGAQQWFKNFGRQVTNWNAGISIIAPRSFITKGGKDLKNTMSPEQWNKVKDEYTRMSFIGVTVYDVSDTAPVEGWTGSEGQGPYEPAAWRQDANENVEDLTALVNAAKEWGQTKGIDVGEEAMIGQKGGYSAGGKIRINDTYQGINLFSTLVHELAHEVLHQVTKERAKREPSKSLEIDAESTAYVVLQHYGFETKDAPNYLALWKAKGKEIKERRENIQRAVRTVIEGIDNTIAKVGLPDETEEEI